MGSVLDRPVSGHVFRVERKRGPDAWYAKYRLPDGRQVKKRLGPAWTKRGRPESGYFTKWTAQAWLDETLASARRGDLAGAVRTGATFSEAAAEWLRYAEQDLIFCDPIGRHLGYKSLSRRYKEALAAAGRRQLRFHDLRHTFGTHAIRAADPREVMEWMGHADIQTTQKYLAYKPRKDAARRLAGAFRDSPRESVIAEPLSGLTEYPM